MPSEEAVIQKLKKKYARPASVAKHAKTGSPTGSWLGAVKLALPNEPWPECDGQPMHGVAQINCLELPYRPPLLADLALITVFMADDDGLAPPHANPYPPPGEGWLLRAYRSLDNLKEVHAPAPPVTESTPVTWMLLESDFPKWEDVASNDSDAVEEAGLEWYDHFETAPGLKVGGWPSLVQSEIYWGPNQQHPSNPEYVFQIDSDLDLDGFFFGDSGCCYFGRGAKGHPHEWAFEWQCL